MAAILLYVLIVRYDGLIFWLRNTIPSMISSTFLVMPVFETIKYRRYGYIDIVSALIGLGFLAVYLHTTQWGFWTAMANYLEMFIAFMVLRTFVQIFYRNIQADRRIF